MRRRTGHCTAHIAAGLLAGLAGAFAMERFQRALGRVDPDLGGAPGGGGQQFRRPQSEPSTYVAADAAQRAITGQPLKESAKPLGGALVHYAFGGSLGALYGAATLASPRVTVGAGLPFATAVWIAADEIGMPLTRLAKRPGAYPLTDHAVSLATHLVYGLTLECVRRTVLRALLPTRQRP